MPTKEPSLRSSVAQSSPSARPRRCRKRPQPHCVAERTFQEQSRTEQHRRQQPQPCSHQHPSRTASRMWPCVWQGPGSLNSSLPRAVAQHQSQASQARIPWQAPLWWPSPTIWPLPPVSTSRGLTNFQGKWATSWLPFFAGLSSLHSCFRPNFDQPRPCHRRIGTPIPLSTLPRHDVPIVLLARSCRWPPDSYPTPATRDIGGFVFHRLGEREGKGKGRVLGFMPACPRNVRLAVMSKRICIRRGPLALDLIARRHAPVDGRC